MYECWGHYYAFCIPLIVMFCAQTLKFLRLAIKYGTRWENLFEPGHFPSAHSAFVTSLVITVGYREGVHTAAFAVALCFAFITIYDAMRVRMHIGTQGRLINRLVKHLPDISDKDFPRLKEHVGHSVTEVIGGVAIGIVLTIALLCTVAP